MYTDQPWREKWRSGGFLCSRKGEGWLHCILGFWVHCQCRNVYRCHLFSGFLPSGRLNVERRKKPQHFGCERKCLCCRLLSSHHWKYLDIMSCCLFGHLSTGRIKTHSCQNIIKDLVHIMGGGFFLLQLRWGVTEFNLLHKNFQKLLWSQNSTSTFSQSIQRQHESYHYSLFHNLWPKASQSHIINPEEEGNLFSLACKDNYAEGGPDSECTHLLPLHVLASFPRLWVDVKVQLLTQ